jgi:hypothetical protein
MHSLEAIEALQRHWSRINRQFCDLIHRGQQPDAEPVAAVPVGRVDGGGKEAQQASERLSN